MASFITRFAPSPTGALHLGHAYSAILVRCAADAAGGRALLRIEDIDTTRCRPEYTRAILDDLAWLGLDWDPPLRIQSEHFGAYAACVEGLASRGLAYRCFRTRREIEAEFGSAAAPVRAGPLAARDEAARLARGETYAWRLSLDAARKALGARWDGLAFTLEDAAGVRADIPAEPALHGDIVLARKDSPSAYHLAACHDDALQGITHIIRGDDLADAPHIHTLLQALCDWPRPVYRHHTLLMGPDGERLAKSRGSKSLAQMRAEGLSPHDVFAQVGLATR